MIINLALLRRMIWENENSILSNLYLVVVARFLIYFRHSVNLVGDCHSCWANYAIRIKPYVDFSSILLMQNFLYHYKKLAFEKKLKWKTSKIYQTMDYFLSIHQIYNTITLKWNKYTGSNRPWAWVLKIHFLSTFDDFK